MDIAGIRIYISHTILNTFIITWLLGIDALNVIYMVL